MKRKPTELEFQEMRIRAVSDASDMFFAWLASHSNALIDLDSPEWPMRVDEFISGVKTIVEARRAMYLHKLKGL
jgi:hypothetical protein